MIRKYIWLLSIAAFFTTTIISAYVIMSISTEMIGSARVINYAGLVRGATQRLVKLEISDNPNDELIVYISDVLTQLQIDDMGTHELKKLHDEPFQDALVELEEVWHELLIEIDSTRAVGFENTNIIEVSESHFNMADEAVSLAERFSDGLLKTYTFTKYILMAATLFLIISLLLLAKKLKLLGKENKRIEQNSHIDLATGLPNKSKCIQKFESYGILSKDIQYGLIVFDLNNLKTTNDKLGHKTGDALIYNFADIIKTNLGTTGFAARYGGDEFIVVYDNVTQEEIEEYIHAVNEGSQRFNQINTKYEIAFAVGYSLSAYEENATLLSMFEKADRKMYKNKMLSKATKKIL